MVFSLSRFRPAIEYVHSPITNGNSPQDGTHSGMVASTSSRELVSLTQSNNQTNPSIESGGHGNRDSGSNRDNTSGNNRDYSSPAVNNAVSTPVERGNRDSRRRSTRHRNYLNRSQLHNAVVELPDGYGE